MRRCGLRPPQGLSRVTSERGRAQAVCSGCCRRGADTLQLPPLRAQGGVCPPDAHTDLDHPILTQVFLPRRRPSVPCALTTLSGFRAALSSEGRFWHFRSRSVCHRALCWPQVVCLLTAHWVGDPSAAFHASSGAPPPGRHTGFLRALLRHSSTLILFIFFLFSSTFLFITLFKGC